jgi:phage nucleotide-binding protein
MAAPKIEKTRTEGREKGTSVVIYGDSGAGKTRLLDAFPVGKLYVLNLDDGLDVLTKQHEYTRFGRTPKDLGRIKESLDWLMEKRQKYDVVAIDDISELEKCFQFALMEIHGKKFLELKEYGDAAQKMREYLRRFRDLTSLGYDVIFIAKEMALETRRNEEAVATKAYPAMTGKLAPEVAGYVDIIGRLMVVKDGRRLLQLDNTDLAVAKCRLPIALRYETPDLIGLLKRARTYRTGGEVKMPADPFKEKPAAKKTGGKK